MTDINETLQQRGQEYGNFEDQAELTQKLKRTMRGVSGWYRMDADMHEALEMVASKVARALNGNAKNIDSWHDIAGYATLVANRLRQDEQEKVDRAAAARADAVDDAIQLYQPPALDDEIPF